MALVDPTSEAEPSVTLGAETKTLGISGTPVAAMAVAMAATKVALQLAPLVETIQVPGVINCIYCPAYLSDEQISLLMARATLSSIYMS